MEAPQPADKIALVWESELRKQPDGSMSLKPVVPVSHMSATQAAKVIGCSRWTVTDLFRLGILKGYKPGERVKRSDGRASNAALRICSGSVMEYKKLQESGTKDWLEGE